MTQIDRDFLGERLSLSIEDATAARWYGGAYRSPELAFVRRRMLRAGDVVVDCGAHQGVTGMLYARWVGPSGRVIGFEAIPSNAALARANAARNGIENFEVRGVAVGRARGEERFENVSNGAVYHGDEGDAVVVPVVRLDDEIEHADFFKIDVEGWELEVLAGAERLLARGPNVLVEVHNYRFEDPALAIAELLRILEPSRWRIAVQPSRDARIVPLDANEHAPARLAERPVVHLYALPKRQ